MYIYIIYIYIYIRGPIWSSAAAAAVAAAAAAARARLRNLHTRWRNLAPANLVNHQLFTKTKAPFSKPLLIY
jgi:hypothetical protein